MGMVVLAVGDEADERLLGEALPEHLRAVRLIVSCGDLSAEYLEALVDRFQVPLLYVRGNHDRRYREAPPPGDNIHGRLVTAAGLRILGFEGSMWYNGEGVQYTERQMWWRVAACRPAIWRARGADIIVTHAPPRGIHDAEDVCHTGFKAFRTLVESVKPRYFVHGHFHLSYRPRAERVTRVGETQVVNAYRYAILPLDASVPAPA